MRVRAAIVLGVLVASGVAGCGGRDDQDRVATAGGGVTPSSSASAGGGGDDVGEAALRYARCMRENGVPDFPDPQVDPNGGAAQAAPEGADREAMQAAMEKCRQYQPDGGVPQKADPEKMDEMRKYSKCMRENGVPNFPDPDENGSIGLDTGKLGMDPTGPEVRAAEKVCAAQLPGGADGGGSLSNDQADG